MATLTERETTTTKDVNSTRTSDDFDMYLKEQRLKTTFNGVEVAEFSWYRRLLGISNMLNK